MTKSNELSQMSDQQAQQTNPLKRDMLAFRRQLRADMRGLRPIEQSRLRNKRLAELTPDEQHEYSVLVARGRSPHFDISS